MFLGSQQFKGRGACWSSEMGLRRMTSVQSLTWTCTNQTTSWLMHNLDIFGARTSHGQIQTHKTHNGPDLGEATTFPLIVYFLPLHRGHIQMAFCPEVGILTILWPHNFVCKPSIAMRYKTKMQPLLKSFQRHVAHDLHTRKLGRYPTFNGRESNLPI